MADIAALHKSAQTKLDKGDAVYALDAATKAIKGAGIFNKGDLKRLKPLVAKDLKVPKRKFS